jgi:hypothetical protein
MHERLDDFREKLRELAEGRDDGPPLEPPSPGWTMRRTGLRDPGLRPGGLPDSVVDEVLELRRRTAARRAAEAGVAEARSALERGRAPDLRHIETAVESVIDLRREHGGRQARPGGAASTPEAMTPSPALDLSPISDPGFAHVRLGKLRWVVWAVVVLPVLVQFGLRAYAGRRTVADALWILLAFPAGLALLWIVNYLVDCFCGQIGLTVFDLPPEPPSARDLLGPKPEPPGFEVLPPLAKSLERTKDAKRPRGEEGGEPWTN